MEFIFLIPLGVLLLIQHAYATNPCSVQDFVGKTYYHPLTTGDGFQLCIKFELFDGGRIFVDTDNPGCNNFAFSEVTTYGIYDSYADNIAYFREANTGWSGQISFESDIAVSGLDLRIVSYKEGSKEFNAKMIFPSCLAPSMAPSSPPTVASTCAMHDLMGKTYFTSYENHCVKVDMFEGGTVTADINNNGCNKSFSESVLYSVFDTISGNQAYFKEGPGNWNGTVSFQQLPTVTNGVELKLIKYDSSSKQFALVLRVESCMAPSTAPSSSPSPSVGPTPQPSSTSTLRQCTWQQVGEDIDGETCRDHSAESISLSGDGSRVVIGSRRHGFGDTGQARVFRFDNFIEDWVQMGQNLEKSVYYGGYGASVSSSKDGTTIAIGTGRGGGIEFFKFDDQTKEWVERMGQYIEGDIASLSEDGTIVALGAPGYNGAGRVRMFQYDDSNSNWIQIGLDINGKAPGDGFGTAVSLTPDGTRIAIGAWGHARMFQYDNISKDWVQMGQDINGVTDQDRFGTSVSLSHDGTVVAIGADYGNGFYGHVRVFQYKSNSDNWIQLGQDLVGEARGDYFGRSVSISKNGDIVAIGGPYNGGNGMYSGHVRVFQYDNSNRNWDQLGEDIDSEFSGDRFGSSVSLSDDGMTLAIGAPENGRGQKFDSGHVRVYECI